MSVNAKAMITAFVSGLVFAAGLVLGGMTDPKKVQGFLDVGGIASGRWDASLAFVMGGALLVSYFAFRGATGRRAPWFASTFKLPMRGDIDAPLIVGAVLFGAGWGIAGYCPGPALASVLTGGKDMLIFVAAMLGGMIAAKLWLRRGHSDGI
jgi:uncharacterized protein